MYTSVNMRSANAYRNVGVETAVTQADPHQLVALLYEALMQSLGSAKLSLEAKDIPGKGKSIGRAVRLIEEGLKASLNTQNGGELAANLHGLYEYSIVCLSEANLYNDGKKIDEVIRLMRPIVDAWAGIRSDVTAMTRSLT